MKSDMLLEMKLLGKQTAPSGEDAIAVFVIDRTDESTTTVFIRLTEDIVAAFEMTKHEDTREKGLKTIVAAALKIVIEAWSK